MSDPEDIPADGAAERALRLNAGEADAALARRAEADPAFAAEVEAWDARLAPLYDEIDPVEAPAGVWPRVAAAIGPEAANDNRAARFWRGWAMASTGLLAASVAGLAFLIANPRVEERLIVSTPDFQPVSVSTLMSEADPDMPVATLTYDPQTGSLYIAPTMQMATPENRAMTLWVTMTDGSVHRIGSIDPSHAQTHSVSEDMRPMAAEAPIVTVSLEPMDQPDSPVPMGPVVATGQVRRL